MSLGQVDSGDIYVPGVTQLEPGQGTATVLVPGNPAVPDISIGAGLSVPGAPPSRTTITRPTVLSGFLQNLSPSLAAALAAKGTGFFGGYAAGFGGIEEQRKYDESLALRRTKEARESALEASTLNYQNVSAAHLQAEIDALKRTPNDKYITSFKNGQGKETGVFQSPTGKTYTTEFGSAQLPESEQPLGTARIGQLNDTFEKRWQVLNPNIPLPKTYMLAPDATQQDFTRLDKQLESTEKALGTKATRDDTLALRQQTQAIANLGKGEKPVVAFNPQTGQRVLSTVSEARASGLTNPISVSESEIEKESSTTKQLNDVALNVGRYKNAINAIPGNISQQSVNHIARILSNDVVNSTVLSPVGMATLPSILEQGSRAADWNALTPEEQQATIGYLRSKGSVIAYQKALTGIGRTNKETLEIEMANLPSPLVGATVANKQLEAFDENVNVASQGLTKVPWLELPSEVRARVEGQGQAQAKAKRDMASNRTSGQFRGTPSQDSGQRAYKPGMNVLIRGRAMTVTKVYPDGTWDAN